MSNNQLDFLATELKKRFKRNNAHLTRSEWAMDMIDKLYKKAKEIKTLEVSGIHIHEGVSNTWVYIEDGIVHVKNIQNDEKNPFDFKEKINLEKSVTKK